MDRWPADLPKTRADPLLRTLHGWLTHPATIIGGVVLGFVFGFHFPEASARLEPAAEIYVALLSMCLLPILVSAPHLGDRADPAGP